MPGPKRAEPGARAGFRAAVAPRALWTTTSSSRIGIMNRFSIRLEWSHGRCILRRQVRQGPPHQESGKPSGDSFGLLTTLACLHNVRYRLGIPLLLAGLLHSRKPAVGGWLAISGCHYGGSNT